MADLVKLQVAEGERVISNGKVLAEGESFEVGQENADSLIESGIAEKPGAKKPSAKKSSDE